MRVLALMVLLLLALAAPAAAGEKIEWQQDHYFQVSLILPTSSMVAGTAYALVVNCPEWERGRCTETHAYLSTRECLQCEVPASLLINQQATRAVLQLLDGSGGLVTWHAIPGDQQIINSDAQYKGRLPELFLGLPRRSISQTVYNYGYATGTLLEQPFDTREIPDLHWSWVQLYHYVHRWLPAPETTP